MPESRPLVRLTGVDVRIADDVVLAHVDLEVGRGERLVVLGPNGGGKTTLLTVLLGLRAPSAGRIERAPGWRSLRKAYVPQFPSFDRNFPVRVEEMVAQARLRAGRAEAAIERGRAVVERQLDRLDLTDLRGAYLTELSGGELKRALIARALAAEPDLLVLDEPTSSLDERSRRLLWQLVEELAGETTIVLATHDLAPSTFAATRAVVVDRRLTELGPEALDGHALLCGHVHE